MTTYQTIEFKTKKEAIERIKLLKDYHKNICNFKIRKTLNNLFAVSYSI